MESSLNRSSFHSGMKIKGEWLGLGSKREDFILEIRTGSSFRNSKEWKKDYEFFDSNWLKLEPCAPSWASIAELLCFLADRGPSSGYF